jgi:hypothetical protein
VLHSEILSQKKKKAGSMTQAIECLLCKAQIPEFKPQLPPTQKKIKRKRKKRKLQGVGDLR